MSDADDAVRAEIAAANAAYEERFGHVYLVCATGKSAEELLDICRGRLTNDAAPNAGSSAPSWRRSTGSGSGSC